MRTLNYPLNTNKVKLMDLYSKIWGEFVLEKGLNTLPYTKREFKLKDSYGNFFKIYEGEGTLEFQDSLEEYDFTRLELEYLDFYLWNEKHHPHALEAQKHCIQKFLNVYEKNIQKGCNYLLPYGFERLDLAFSKGSL